MSRIIESREYTRANAAAFLKTKEEFGGLSNMAAGFPLRVNGVDRMIKPETWTNSYWKLADAYALATVFADGPLEVHRCDKPTGQFVPPAFLYP